MQIQTVDKWRDIVNQLSRYIYINRMTLIHAFKQKNVFVII